MAIKIFISHSSQDEALASVLTDFLMTSVKLDDSEIRCTSVPGHKLPVGSDTAITLRDELSDTAIVIGLITRYSISSAWVLFELGAAWGARKNPKSLLTDDVGYKDLPGPLSGQHVARLSSKSDLIQLVDEISELTGSTKRTSPKIDGAIDKLISAHANHINSNAAKSKPEKLATAPKEPSFSGIPFSELCNLLQNEVVTIPVKARNSKKESKYSLLDLFVMNYAQLAEGIDSNFEYGSADEFLYREVALRLIPYKLVKFEKLPAAQARWLKRIVLSDDGQIFLAHYRRIFKKPKDKA